MDRGSIVFTGHTKINQLKTIICVFLMKRDQKKLKHHLDYWTLKERLQSGNCLLEICRNVVEAWGNNAQLKWKHCFQPDVTEKENFIIYQLPPPNQSPQHEESSIYCQCVCYSHVNVRRKCRLEGGSRVQRQEQVSARSRCVCQGEGMHKSLKQGR